MRADFDEKFQRALTPKDYARFKVGDAAEAAMLGGGLLFDMKKHHECMWRDYQFVRDGLDCSTDALCMGRCNKGRPLVWEGKSTKFGTGRTIEDPVFTTYHWQAKSYVYVAEKELKKRPDARFVFMYLNGDYKDRDIVISGWDITYETPELQKNWSMILDNRDRMLKEWDRQGRKYTESA